VIPFRSLRQPRRARFPAAVKAAAADDVDRKSRFLSEAIDLLKDARLLSCSLPTDLGGRSYGIAELAVIARALGGACSSAGMVFAMHHAQALSLAHHAHEGQIARLTSRIAADESLLASATTEITTGGGPDEHIFPDTGAESAQKRTAAKRIRPEAWDVPTVRQLPAT
jgi:alkylation response protein AidB-like acyl-CoA dehydrogenase